MSAAGNEVRFWGRERCKHINHQNAFTRGLAFIKLFMKIWALPLLVAAGIGIYLSYSIVPWVISALVASGMAPWLTLLLAIATCGALLFAAIALPLSRFLEGMSIVDSLRPDTNTLHGQHARWPRPVSYLISAWYILALLVGVGFGVYLATLIAPLVISALTAMGLGYGWALVAGITAGIALVCVSVDLLAQPAVILQTIHRLQHLAHCILGCHKPSNFANLKGKGLPYMIAGVAGAGLGIYAATMLSPLIISTLAAMSGINVAIATFVAVAVSVALIAGFARVFSAVGMLSDGLVSRIALARQTELPPIELAIAKMDVVQAVVLGGPLTELTFFARGNFRAQQQTGVRRVYIASPTQQPARDVGSERKTAAFFAEAEGAEGAEQQVDSPVSGNAAGSVHLSPVRENRRGALWGTKEDRAKAKQAIEHAGLVRHPSLPAPARGPSITIARELSTQVGGEGSVSRGYGHSQSVSFSG